MKKPAAPPRSAPDKGVKEQGEPIFGPSAADSSSRGVADDHSSRGDPRKVGHQTEEEVRKRKQRGEIDTLLSVDQDVYKHGEYSSLDLAGHTSLDQTNVGHQTEEDAQKRNLRGELDTLLLVDQDVHKHGVTHMCRPSGEYSSLDLAGHTSLNQRFTAPAVTRTTSEKSINLGTSPSSAPDCEQHSRGKKRMKISLSQSVQASKPLPPDIVRNIVRKLAADDLKTFLEMKLGSKALGAFEGAIPIFTISCRGPVPKAFFLKVVSGDGGGPPLMKEADLLFPPPPGSSLCWGASNGLMAWQNDELNLTTLHCSLCGYQQLLAEVPHFMKPKGLYSQHAGSTALVIMEVGAVSKLCLQIFCDSDIDEEDLPEVPSEEDSEHEEDDEEEDDEDLYFVAEEEGSGKHLQLNANQQAKEGTRLLAEEVITAEHDNLMADDEDLDDEDLGEIKLTWSLYPGTECYSEIQSLAFSNNMTFVAVTSNDDLILNKRNRQVGQKMKVVTVDINDEEYVLWKVNSRHVFTVQQQIYVCCLLRSKADDDEVRAQVYALESPDDALAPVSDIGDFCVYLGSNQPIVLPSDEGQAGRSRNTLYFENKDDYKSGLSIIAVEIDTQHTTIIPFPDELEAKLLDETWVSTWVCPPCGHCQAAVKTPQQKPQAAKR